MLPRRSAPRCVHFLARSVLLRRETTTPDSSPVRGGERLCARRNLHFLWRRRHAPGRHLTKVEPDGLRRVAGHRGPDNGSTLSCHSGEKAAAASEQTRKKRSTACTAVAKTQTLVRMPARILRTPRARCASRSVDGRARSTCRRRSRRARGTTAARSRRRRANAAAARRRPPRRARPAAATEQVDAHRAVPVAPRVRDREAARRAAASSASTFFCALQDSWRSASCICPAAGRVGNRPACRSAAAPCRAAHEDAASRRGTAPRPPSRPTRRFAHLDSCSDRSFIFCRSRHPRPRPEPRREPRRRRPRGREWTISPSCDLAT